MYHKYKKYKNLYKRGGSNLTKQPIELQNLIGNYLTNSEIINMSKTNQPNKKLYQLTPGSSSECFPYIPYHKKCQQGHRIKNKLCCGVTLKSRITLSSNNNIDSYLIKSIPIIWGNLYNLSKNIFRHLDMSIIDLYIQYNPIPINEYWNKNFLLVPVNAKNIEKKYKYSLLTGSVKLIQDNQIDKNISQLITTMAITDRNLFLFNIIQFIFNIYTPVELEDIDMIDDIDDTENIQVWTKQIWALYFTILYYKNPSYFKETHIGLKISKNDKLQRSKYSLYVFHDFDKLFRRLFRHNSLQDFIDQGY
jgi:hypothetical protein